MWEGQKMSKGSIRDAHICGRIVIKISDAPHKRTYSIPAEELIDTNCYKNWGRATEPQSSPNGASYQDACIRAGVVESGSPHASVLTHLTPPVKNKR